MAENGSKEVEMSEARAEGSVHDAAAPQGAGGSEQAAGGQQNLLEAEGSAKEGAGQGRLEVQRMQLPELVQVMLHGNEEQRLLASAWLPRFAAEQQQIGKDAAVAAAMDADEQGGKAPQGAGAGRVVFPGPSVHARVNKPPEFTGSDPNMPLELWLSHLRAWFKATHTPAHERVWVATTYLRGNAAAQWHVAAQSRGQRHMAGEAGCSPNDWDVFCQEMQAWFEPINPAHAARRALDALQQRGDTAEAYGRKFLLAVARVGLHSQMTEADQVHRFLHGLNDNLRVCAAVNPCTGRPFEKLHEMVQFVCRIDAALRDVRPAVRAAQQQTREAEKAGGWQEQRKKRWVPGKGAAGGNGKVREARAAGKGAGGERGQKRAAEKPAYFVELSAAEKKQRKDSRACYRCGAQGHMARDCPK